MATIPLNNVEAGTRFAFASNFITQDVITVTPSMAEQWLKLNVNNRPISPNVVEKYKRDMLTGRWVYAADPIRFDTYGNLLDGQHRLTALSYCEDGSVEVQFLVIRGLPKDTQLVMDQGRKRNAGQQLSILGVKNAANVASGVKVYLLWQNGLLFRDSTAANLTISTPQIEEWVSGNPDLVAHVNSHQTALRSNDAPPSVSFAAALKFASIAPDAEEQFFQALSHGGTAVKHPINTLDKRLQRIRREGFRMSQRDYLALFIQAWNATRDGRTLTQFLRPKGATWTAETFPEPR